MKIWEIPWYILPSFDISPLIHAIFSDTSSTVMFSHLLYGYGNMTKYIFSCYNDFMLYVEGRDY